MIHRLSGLTLGHAMKDLVGSEPGCTSARTFDTIGVAVRSMSSASRGPTPGPTSHDVAAVANVPAMNVIIFPSGDHAGIRSESDSSPVPGIWVPSAAR